MSRVQSERRTSGLESRWREVLETAPEVYVAVDGEGVVQDWNRAASRLFGPDKADAVGALLTRFVPDGAAASVLAHLAAAVDRAGGDAPDPLELDLLTAAGHRFSAECLVWGVDRRDGLLLHLFVRDVDDRRRAQETAALLAAVVDGSTDAVITENRDGRLVSWNRAAELMFGWTAEQMIGTSGAVLLPHGKADEHRGFVADVLASRVAGSFETERLSCSGELVPVAVRMSPVRDASGRVMAVSYTARDISEQRWLAQTLDSTSERLQVALDEATVAEESSRRFLADAAHQLRTPLTGIRACAELLLRGAPEADRDRLLATMVRETARSAHLITALLRIARLDQGEAPPPGSVDLVAVCRDEVDRLSLLSPDLAVVLEAGEAVPLLLLDMASCHEILSNLGDNARRHAATRVVFRVEVAGGQLVVRVTDDGAGVLAMDAERIFERFVSLDGGSGSGLGLPIARGLARALGGDLRYADGFCLTLPLLSA